jgi:hypothetical protein
MSILVEHSAEVNVPAAAAYTIIADMKHHDRITPKPPFGPLTIERGGVGAGTVISFQVTFFGRTDNCRSTIAEPQPGRVMVETETVRNTVSTFTVDPLGSKRSRVTISCLFQTRRGIAGAVEGWLVKRLMTPVLIEELRLLEEYGQTNRETLEAASVVNATR